MKRFHILMALAFSVITLGLPKAHAAYDIFLQIPGVPGESKDANHPGWIDVLSFTHGIANPVTSQTGTGGASKPTHADFQVGKLLDKASAPLDLMVNQGTVLTSPVVVEFQKTGSSTGSKPVVFYRVTLTDAVVDSVSTSGSAGGDSISESITIHYKKIKWQYYPIDANGKVGAPVTSEWDVAANVGK